MNGVAAAVAQQQPLDAPPPASASREELPGATAEPAAQAADADHGENGEADEGSQGDEDEDEVEDDDDADDDNSDSYPWHPIEEDKSHPCDDELTYIQSREEHTALDHAYWEQESFFDLDDPELKPGESGRIDWLVEHFNGTKESPNKQLIMKSPVVRIGGYDWQIKFYPKGNRTEFLSVYLECVSMQKDDFVDRVDFAQPPLPILAGSEPLKQRVSVAAQVSIVMYNPAEPRVYEYRADAHQFHKGMPDFGWKYFSREPRYEFHFRKHAQRQAILRDDRLAFSAYIRVIDDPTGCMWDTGLPNSENVVAATSLRPIDGVSAQIAALMLLFHLRPFRAFLYKSRPEGTTMFVFQLWLDKFLSRRLKRKHLLHCLPPTGGDVVTVLHDLRGCLAEDRTPDVLADFDAVFTSFEPSELPVCSNRVKTSDSASIQEAVRKQPLPTKTPLVLTLELERQRFNKAQRKWEKIENKVHLDDTLVYGNTEYSLYAFVTHAGQLGSNLYTPYIRPGGPGGLWYAYDTNQVKCLTQQAAVATYCGGEPVKTKQKKEDISPFRTSLPATAGPRGIAYLAMYVRHDIADYTFKLPVEEVWAVPDALRRSHRSGKRGGATTAGTKQTCASAKDDVASLVTLATESRQSAPEVLDGTNGADQAPNEPSVEIMDGDDVIMSDAEDGGFSPIPFTGTLDNAVNVQHEPALPSDEKACATSLRNTVFDFFSGEYYEGQVLPSGAFHGDGHLVRTNGDEYVGNFSHRLPSGKGTMVYGASGNTYEGEWLNGQHHGQGRLTELQTGNVFEGGWKDGRRHGSFVLRGTVTDDDKQGCQICYDREMNTAFYDCGHVLACQQCSTLIEVCPVCRKRVIARLELFGVKVSME